MMDKAEANYLRELVRLQSEALTTSDFRRYTAHIVTRLHDALDEIDAMRERLERLENGK